MMETLHCFSTVQGVKCITWSFGNLLDARKKKSYKDRVCRSNINTIALDKRGNSFCDAIVISNNIEQVVDTMTVHYENKQYVTDEKPLGHGKQISFLYHDVVNCYPSTKKLMVQPAHKKEDMLLDWIRESPNFLPPTVN